MFQLIRITGRKTRLTKLRRELKQKFILRPSGILRMNETTYRCDVLMSMYDVDDVKASQCFRESNGVMSVVKPIHRHN